jgi:hypothetical protein
MKKQALQSINFDNSTVDFILDAFDKARDSEGYVVEKSNPSQRVLTDEGVEIKADEFAGVVKGSEVYFKSDLVSLIKLSDRLKG